MKQPTKRLLAGFLSAVMLSSLLATTALAAGVNAAHGQKASSSASSKTNTNTPVGTIKAAFGALKELDIKKFNQYTDNMQIKENGRKSSILFEENLAGEEKELAQRIVANLTYEIVGDAAVTGTTAKVRVKVSNSDYSKVMGIMIADMFKAAAKNGDMSLMEDDAVILKETLSLMDKANADEKRVGTELTVTLKKENGAWRIKLGEHLINAIVGRFFSGADDYLEKLIEEMQSSLQKSIENDLMKNAAAYAQAAAQRQ